MRKPNIAALPTSQMSVFLTFFGIDEIPLVSVTDRIKALEEVPQSEWTKLKVGRDTRDAETVDKDIVKARKADMAEVEE